MSRKNINISLTMGEQLKQAVKNLRKAGIMVKVWVDKDSYPETGYILIDINSLAEIVEKKLTYPNRKVYIKDNYMIVEVWKE